MRNGAPSGAGEKPEGAELAAALRIVVITDEQLAAPRSVEEVVEMALAGGARTIQLRAKGSAPGSVLETADRLRTVTRRAGALLFVNDRLDIALAAAADGVHLGPDDVPLAAARRVVPPDFLVGWSTDDPMKARRAELEGADYIGCGSVYATRTKDVGEEAIGLDRLDEVARAVSIPVVGIGGITPARATEVRSTAAAGVAVVSAVMGAPDPTAVVRSILAALSPPPQEGS